MGAWRALFEVVADAAPFDEGAAAIGVELFLPDRRAVFDRVDGVATSLECLGAVRRTHDADDGDIADGEVTQAVDDPNVGHAEFFARGGFDVADDLRRKRLVRRVFKVPDRTAFVVVSN